MQQKLVLQVFAAGLVASMRECLFLLKDQRMFTMGIVPMSTFLTCSPNGCKAHRSFLPVESLTRHCRGLGIYFIKSNASWRLLLGLQLLPSALMLIGSFWMPFSPRWLALKGRYEECLQVLKRMHGDAYDKTFYLREYHQIRAQIEYDKKERLGMRAIWSRPSYRKRFILVFMFAACCQ